MVSSPAEQLPRLDVLVAVHGIGDQVPYETLQHLIDRCFEHRKLPAGVPLGEIATRLAAPSAGAPGPAGSPGAAWAEFTRLPGLAFAEVFWADIGRANQEYVLEDTVSWARTLTGRLQVLQNRLPASAGPDHARYVDLAAVERTIGDIGVVVQLVRAVNRGCAAIGLGSVDLDRMLTNFLGDVQLLAEFAPQRVQIRRRFDDVMSAIEKRAAETKKDVRIHVCAHSQGSAVALLGLLEGWAARAPWLARVRSLMTIGSPIDKFLILWPDLWNDFFTKDPWRSAQAPIKWRNYADRGDPVGYELDTARVMVAQLDPNLFEAGSPKDVIYSRYPLPGKAHVDYWSDQHVFDDWLGSCVDGGSGVPVPSRFGIAPVRLAITFGLPIGLAVLCSRTFVEAVNCVLGSDVIGSSHVAAIAAAVVGSVAMAGAARASKRWYWPALGAAVFACGASWIVVEGPRAIAIAGCLALLITSLLPVWWHRLRTSAGLRACMRAVVVLGSVGAVLFHAGASAGSSPWVALLWLAASMAAWWLATLLWDTAVVWVEYVGRGRHLDYLRSTLHVPVSREKAPGAAESRTRARKTGSEAKKTRLWWIDCSSGA
ncbi:MAG TPA: hypothetical protein VF384_07295 [Planctomycetota bacterium]